MFFTPPNFHQIILQHPSYLHVFTSGVENSVDLDQIPDDLNIHCFLNRNGYIDQSLSWKGL